MLLLLLCAWALCVFACVVTSFFLSLDTSLVPFLVRVLSYRATTFLGAENSEVPPASVAVAVMF